MATKYKIIFHDGRNSISGLTLDEAMDYKVGNLSTSEEYVISEEVSKRKTTSKSKSKNSVSDEENEQTRKEFMSLLVPLQLQGIENGTRKIRYSKEIGYYLQVITKDDVPFFSTKIEETRAEKILKLKRRILETEAGEDIAKECINMINFLKIYDMPLFTQTIGRGARPTLSKEIFDQTQNRSYRDNLIDPSILDHPETYKHEKI